MDNLRRELNVEKANLEARKAKVEARERKINKVPELEERAQSLESELQRLQSNTDNLSKMKDELEAEIRSKKEVLNEIKDYKEREGELTNQLSGLKKAVAEKKSELSNILDQKKESAEMLSDTQRKVENGNFSLRRINHEIFKKSKENVGLAIAKERLDKEIRARKEAINKIEQSYYEFIKLTKQIALSIDESGLPTKTKTHEELREKVLRDMEKTMKEAQTSKPDPDSESDLQTLLRDPTILERFFSKKSSRQTL